MNIQQYLTNKNIALVGNAKSLFNKNRVKHINSHDIVWRMNWGVNLTSKQKQLVGKRCEVYSAGGPRGVKTTFTVQKPQYYLFTPGNECTKSKTPPKYSNVPDEVTLNLKKKLQHTDSKPVFPSTGLIALTWITKYIDFKTITLFGFDFFKTRTFYRNMDHFGGHKPKREEEIFNEMINNNQKITIIT